MPQYNRRELDVKAHEYGFNRDTFEKVLRLRTILEFLIMKFKNCTFFHNNSSFLCITIHFLSILPQIYVIAKCIFIRILH